MSENEKYLSEQGIQDDIDHDVDPFLAYVAKIINDEIMAEQDLWLCLSGMFVTGKIGTNKEGFFKFMGSREEYRPQEGGEPDKDSRPRHLYLREARIVRENGNVINFPVMRIKLSHVSAWGFGYIDPPNNR